jgi:hypothetical protein
VRSIVVNAGRRSAGGRLGLEWPAGIAVDRQGTVYVANYWPGNAVAVYTAGAEGDVAPTRLVQGGKTRLAGPVAVALDSEGWLHVASVPEPAGFSQGGEREMDPGSLFRQLSIGLPPPVPSSTSAGRSGSRPTGSWSTPGTDPRSW